MSDTLERVRRWDAVVGVDEAVARAVAEERAAVVAWLRGHAEHYSRDVNVHHPATALWDAAICIERGEHRHEEEP